MQKTSTPNVCEVAAPAVNIKPKRATVELLKQYARVYTCIRLMPAVLGGFVAN